MIVPTATSLTRGPNFRRITGQQEGTQISVREELPTIQPQRQKALPEVDE
jgi:hypothetical protein